jgi:hypothetical protein
MSAMEGPHIVRPEPVEGLPYPSVEGEGEGFDKLSPNGFPFAGGC